MNWLAVLVPPMMLLLAVAQPTTRSASKLPPTPPEVRVDRDIEYLPAGREEKCDLYFPIENHAGRKLPAVIIIHGGGFNDGDKARAREINIGTTLALNGYVGMSVNYKLRVKGQVTWPHCLHDLKSAVRWLRKNADRLGVDPDRIAALGCSAGGNLAAMLAVTRPQDGFDSAGPDVQIPTDIRCAIDFYGAVDLLNYHDMKMFNATREEAPQLYRAASPTSYVHWQAAPLLIVHGTADAVVSVSQSQTLADLLSAAGAEHELLILPGVPHTFDLQPRGKDLRPVVLGFLDKHLKGADSDPAPQTAAGKSPRTVAAWMKDGPPAPRPVRLIEDLPGFQPAEKVELDEFGGWTGKSLRASGFFRVEKVGGRWWMVTPAGRPFFNIAATSVNVSDASATLRQNFDARFKSKEDWRDAALALLTSHGFNGTGPWSDDAQLASATRRLPYTSNINFMAGYGKKRGGTYMKPGHVGYPNDCIFVFDPGFEAYCDERMRELSDKKDDPYLIGYFSDNEMPFRIDALDLYLNNPPPDPGRLAAEAFMAERRGPQWVQRPLRDEDRQAWMEKLSDRYFSIASRAIRKHDPNHLFLGARFHDTDLRNPALFRSAGKHVDVISYNLYYVWTPTPELIRQWTDWSGRPVMITEFYAKGQDSGMKNLTGAGWSVPSQQERGWFYQHFVLSLIESKGCVGWHWLRYIDNAPDDKKADPSNLDSNKGLVNVRFEPYDAMLGEMKRLNQQVYPLSAYFDDPR